MNRFLIVTSNDKTSDSVSNSDFKVRLGDTYFSQQVCGISVVSCTVPNVIYNINEHNNTLAISKDPIDLLKGVSTITVPLGQYTISELMSAIDFQITQADQVPPIDLTIVQDAITQKIVFTDNFRFIFYNTVTYPSTMWELLGFDPEITQYVSVFEAGPNLWTVRPPYLPNLSGNQYLNILSNLSENNSIDGQGVKSLLEIVNLYDTPFGSYHTQTTNMAEHAVIKYVNPRNLNNITIKLVDEKYRDIDIGNFSVTVVLRIYFSTF
jgi:hypothetical protein